MPSSLTWVDHDIEARERSIRILALFKEKDSRDELGLGAIRDSFSDTLFPGTSTIQTRMRYMLFVPWIYIHLEAKRVHPPTFAAKARQIETALVEPLLKDPDHAGVFGSVAGSSIKRLPSSVYWNGLGEWGIRSINCSLDEYHRGVDQIYRRRDEAKKRREDDDLSEPEANIWHPGIPVPPKGFPEKIQKLNFQLSLEEAGFLLDRLLKSNPESFLAYLVKNCKPVDCDFPWQHPDIANFKTNHREILDYAEFFSNIMQGAAFLYNLMLAEIDGRPELEEEHRNNLSQWQTRLASCRNIKLPIEGLWEHTVGANHNITLMTKKFIENWHIRVLSTGGDVADDRESRIIVKDREIKLKGARSRFKNDRAREQWSGHAGTAQLAFRWQNVKTLLRDLHAGLKGARYA